jgi:hypothetical protein
MIERTTNEYRGYFIGNMYLSSIQQGIQAAHVIQDMYTNLRFQSHGGAKTFIDWMNIDRTMILLNGGYQSSLEALYSDFRHLTKNGTIYPIGSFREEQEALNGCMTSVGIILPKRVYDYENAGTRYYYESIELPEIEYKIFNLIKNFKLA